MTNSRDRRERVARAVRRGRPLAEIARTYGVERSTIRAWRDRAVRGELAPGSAPPRGHTKLTNTDLQILEREVAADPGMTLWELRGKLSVKVAESTVHRVLRKLGLSLKKVADPRESRWNRSGPTSPSVAKTSRSPAALCRRGVVPAAVLHRPQPDREAVEQGQSVGTQAPSPGLRRDRRSLGLSPTHRHPRSVPQRLAKLWIWRFRMQDALRHLNYKRCA